MGRFLFIVLGVFTIFVGVLMELYAYAYYGDEITTGIFAGPAIMVGILFFLLALWMKIRKRKQRLKEVEEEEILKQRIRLRMEAEERNRNQ